MSQVATYSGMVKVLVTVSQPLVLDEDLTPTVTLVIASLSA